MATQSAGILLYRKSQGAIEVLIVHPGGPFWKNKDDGAWSVPKGEVGKGEVALEAAKREFEEELGLAAPEGAYVDLGSVKLKSGKAIQVFAVAGDFDIASLKSNTFEIDWPPRSGKRQSFPEVDRAGWFAPDAAKVKLNPAQAELVDRLMAILGRGDG